ncbi:MAG: hypothetical protein K2X81_24520 [Candidatus Obscuribacterales bacterium]|nr:hypothetical protein [Candidatus Obscuribacterales bacterium]
MISSRITVLAALVLVASGSSVSAQYDDNTQSVANDIINKSLSSVGKCVVVTISSGGVKDQEYYAKLPNDKNSPKEDNAALSIIEVTKRINAAIDKAKSQKKDSTITIKVETKVPAK